ncbi:hypothetical protein ANN_11300 [Periplaneta americana]|uniref:Uncharacterized protein n=1 Tax=Periplaneta americana TaxID=6978 RepID=A0ABQ8T4M2_PERAM|nr:hypothetical protein ANN_11300 [Periplaneta americana]
MTTQVTTVQPMTGSYGLARSMWTSVPRKKSILSRLRTSHNIRDIGQGLSNSEWRDGIKMVGNVAAVLAVPGRSQDNRCRHCHNEVETLAHVLGFCPHGEALRSARHHQVRSIIATALKDADYNTFEEVHGLSVTGSTRRIDIITFKESTRSGYIIDPTVRFETDEEQPAEVDNEKKNIYNPTIPYYLKKYQLKELEVMGLLVGARACKDPSQVSLRTVKPGQSYASPAFTAKEIPLSQILGNGVYYAAGEKYVKGKDSGKEKRRNNEHSYFEVNELRKSVEFISSEFESLREELAHTRHELNSTQEEMKRLVQENDRLKQEVVVITEDVQNVHFLLEYRPHIDVSLTCEHDPKLQEYCVCPQNMPQFDSEGIPNQALETNKPMILNGPTSRNREGSDQETFDPSTGEPYD